MHRESQLVVSAMVCVLALSAQAAGQEQPDGVPKDRLERLTRGVNLSMWFAQLPPDAERFKNYIKAEDIRLIKRLGFRHVRLIVDPKALMNPGNPGQLKEQHLKLLDAAIDMILAEKLAIVVCPYADNEYKHFICTRAGDRLAFGAFLRAFVGHLSRRDPELVFLQVLNEPSLPNPELWNRVQEELIPQMRRSAPKHTLIASSNMRNARGGWDLVGGMEALKPVADANVVYDFHFYDPVQFTHQGATWMTWQVQHYENLPYPSSPDVIAPFIEKISNQGARDFAELYGREKWNRDRIERQIMRAVTWAKKHNVPIICGEFGCYRRNTPAADRLTYLRDVREVLEKHNVGWAMWDYLGDFGVVTEKDGKRVPDEDTAAALGLPGAKDAKTPASKPAPSGEKGNPEPGTQNTDP
ncbi:MAG TPA: cellulase family glycosylhydrolase [Phycisphaerae bacterium]|nr:cellulase family glycosylhydrolase [Phycisphaerae bacterium]